jgi:hypothetical protein
MCPKARYIFKTNFSDLLQIKFIFSHFLPHERNMVTYRISCCFIRNNLKNILQGSVLATIRFPGSTKWNKTGTEGRHAKYLEGVMIIKNFKINNFER